MIATKIKHTGVKSTVKIAHDAPNFPNMLLNAIVFLFSLIIIIIIIIIIIFIRSDQCKHWYHEQEIPEVIPTEGIPF